MGAVSIRRKPPAAERLAAQRTHRLDAAASLAELRRGDELPPPDGGPQGGRPPPALTGGVAANTALARAAGSSRGKELSPTSIPIWSTPSRARPATSSEVWTSKICTSSGGWGSPRGVPYVEFCP